MTGLAGATSIAAGRGYDDTENHPSHLCVLLRTGTVRCWGNNSEGQLGDGTTKPRPTPVTVLGVSGATAIAAGGATTCAVVTGGQLQCWGELRGRRADGMVAGSAGTISVDVGDSQVCAVVARGSVRCWGYRSSSTVGGAVSAGSAIAASQSCVVLASGRVWCWGDNGSGQLGVDPGWTPQAVPGL